jgi:hypothetical protein
MPAESPNLIAYLVKKVISNKYDYRVFALSFTGYNKRHYNRFQKYDSGKHFTSITDASGCEPFPVINRDRIVRSLNYYGRVEGICNYAEEIRRQNRM